MTGCAVGESAMRAGRPNSSMASRGAQKGQRPPNVVADATNKGTIWRQANCSNIVAKEYVVVGLCGLFYDTKKSSLTTCSGEKYWLNESLVDGVVAEMRRIRSLKFV